MLRDGHRLVALAPALTVSAIALFVLPHTAGGFRLAKWGVFGMGLAVVASSLLVRKLPPRFPRHGVVVTVFVALAITLPAFSSSLMPTHWPNALGMLAGLSLSLVTAFALTDDDARQTSFTVLIAAGALCALLVVLQLAGLRWLTDDTYGGLEFRAPSTFGNPNWAAAFLAALVPLALGRAAIAERRWPYRAAAALLGVCAMATFSKNGALTLAAGVLAFAIMSAGRRLQIVLAAVALALVGVVVAVLLAHTQASWLRGRIFLWRVALELIGEHPLVGVGLGGYVPAYGRGAAVVVNGDPAAFMPLSSIDFAHNDLLQLAAECGIATMLMFVAVTVFAIAFAHKLADPLSRGAGAGIAALFVNGLTDSPLKVPSTFALLFFLLGWLGSRSLRDVASPVVGRLVLVTVVLLGALQGVRFIAGDAYWTQGRDALRGSTSAVAALERARTFMPEHGRSASQYARALARDGKIDAAIAASAVAAKRRFDFDDEIFRRDLQTRTLDRDTAIALWQELAATFPSLITPHLRLGALYLQVNDRAAATREYELVVSSTQPTARAEAARRQAQTVLDTALRGQP